MYELNEHWHIVASGGTQLSNTPTQLWEAALSYFKWCDDNPIKSKTTILAGKEAGRRVEVETTRPYTIKGMCLHCGINERYIQDIKDSNRNDSEYYIVMEKILMIIYTQNLEGGITNLFNPIMVSKVLNMDKGSDDNVTNNVRIEIVGQQSSLSSSENEVLKKLDAEKMQILKDKSENP